MNQLLTFEGNQEDLQIKLTEYKSTIRGLVIDETGKEAAVTFFKYGGIRTRFSIHVVFLGSTTHFLFFVSNMNTGVGVLNVWEGEWDSDFTMRSIYNSVSTCFPMVQYKQLRGILMEIGELIYSVLTKYDEPIAESIFDEGPFGTIKVNLYEILTDVEWIEQIMEEG